jgi:drug/metabolite transporter (DMT)-like permease
MNRFSSFLDTRSPAAPRVGLLLALGTAVVSGVAVFLNGQAVRAVGDPIVFTTLKNGVAAVVLLGLALAYAASRGTASTPSLPRGRMGWVGLVALGIVGGSVPFALFFTGLADASAPAAAVIHKTLFVWVALLAVVFLRERLGGLQIAALVVLLGAQLLIQPPNGVVLGGGELLIALATAFWAVETILARRLLASVGTAVAGAARMGIGLVLLVGWLAVTGRMDGIGTLGMTQWAWVLGTGLLLSAYVATWYAALKRAPASAVTAVLTIGAPITGVLQVLANGQMPQPGVALGYLVTAGAAGAIGLLAVRGKGPRSSAAHA